MKERRIVTTILNDIYRTLQSRLVDKNQVLLLVQATKYSRDHKMYEFMYRAVQKWNPNTFFRNSGYCQHLAETKINYLAYIATCIIIKHVQQPHKNTSIIFICPMYCRTLQLVTWEAKGSIDESFSYAVRSLYLSTDELSLYCGLQSPHAAPSPIWTYNYLRE